MRKWNAVLTAVILVLFLIHAILGSFQLFGIGNTAGKAIARAAEILIWIHVLIGVKLTVDTLRAQHKAGARYFRENALFWARRISGFAVMVLLLFHFNAFGDNSGPLYRLRVFDSTKLISQLLLVLSIALHVITNVKPALIAFGIKSWKARTGEILAILSVLLLVIAAAFIVYYLRWNTN